MSLALIVRLAGFPNQSPSTNYGQNADNPVASNRRATRKWCTLFNCSLTQPTENAQSLFPKPVMLQTSSLSFVGVDSNVHTVTLVSFNVSVSCISQSYIESILPLG